MLGFIFPAHPTPSKRKSQDRGQHISSSQSFPMARKHSKYAKIVISLAHRSQSQHNAQLFHTNEENAHGLSPHLHGSNKICNCVIQGPGGHKVLGSSGRSSILRAPPQKSHLPTLFLIMEQKPAASLVREVGWLEWLHLPNPTS